MSHNFVTYKYCESNTMGTAFQFLFNQLLHLTLWQEMGLYWTSYQETRFEQTDIYHRGTLDYDEVFRQQIYPKVNGTSAGGWSLVWSIIFNIYLDICQGIQQYCGVEPCGLNSYCTLGGDQGPICELYTRLCLSGSR